MKKCFYISFILASLVAGFFNAAIPLNQYIPGGEIAFHPAPTISVDDFFTGEIEESRNNLSRQTVTLAPDKYINAEIKAGDLHYCTFVFGGISTVPLYLEKFLSQLYPSHNFW